MPNNPISAIELLKLMKARFEEGKGVTAAGKKIGVSEPTARKYIRQVEEIVKG